MNEGLLVTKVPRALELKNKLFGFELPDLLLIFLNLALSNLVFGGTNYRYTLVWGSTILIASFLYFAKRGKPDNYLQHFALFFIRPSYYCAGLGDKIYKSFKKEIPL